MFLQVVHTLNITVIYFVAYILLFSVLDVIKLLNFSHHDKKKIVICKPILTLTPIY